MKGSLANCSALSRWTLDFVRRNAGVDTVPLKDLRETEIQVTQKKLDVYIDELEDFEARRDEPSNSPPAPAYLHDIPLTALLPQAHADLESFPWRYFPSWYGEDWAKFAQVFLGPRESLTPLHFDCLLTHNLLLPDQGPQTLRAYSRRAAELVLPA